MISRRFLGLGALSVVGAVALPVLSGCTKPPSFQGVDLTGAAYARGFSLPDQNGKTRTLEDFKGNWLIMFSHPADFTPVCTTEIGELARRNAEFEARNVKLIGLSIDSIHSQCGPDDTVVTVRADATSSDTDRSFAIHGTDLDSVADAWHRLVGR